MHKGSVRKWVFMGIYIALCVLSQIHERTSLTHVMGKVHTYMLISQLSLPYLVHALRSVEVLSPERKSSRSLLGFNRKPTRARSWKTIA